ncbi:Ty3/Gypsy retrotransposon protein, partial [Trifolium medium]|nr:Ty3/Gypsy retrotransposon protein [Trifolium medium]
MRLEGQIFGASVLVLIDSGATHNFISPTVVEALGLSLTHSTPLSVRLGDGHRIMTSGYCDNIVLHVGDMIFTIQAHVLGIGDVDLILGVVWLETLGKVTMDWHEMSMAFEYGGKSVTL